MHNKKRAGFTLVEVIFAVIVSAMLLGVFYNIFFTQHSQAYRLTKKNEAMTSALVAAEVIGKDLRQIVTTPITKLTNGAIQRVYGDHTAPVKVSNSGSSVSFYVPRPPESDTAFDLSSRTRDCVTVVYATVPSKKPGAYHIRRSIVEDPSVMQAYADGTGDLPGKNISGVLVRKVAFRLLDPKATATVYRSPDSNYYLEAIIVGTDATAKETQALPLLVNLEYPSTQQMTPNIQEVVAYRAEAPLVTAPDTFNPSPQEQQTINQINELTDQFVNGSIPASEYEDKITDLINSHAGDTDGPIIRSTGNIIPHVDKLEVVQTPNPGEPVVLNSPNGTSVVVAPPASPSSPGTPSSNTPPISTITPTQGDWWVRGGSMHFSNGQLVHSNTFQGGGSGNMSQGDLQNVLDGWMNDQYNMYGNNINGQRGNTNVVDSFNNAQTAVENLSNRN